VASRATRRNVSAPVMTRINTGIHPRYLADQHLVAESGEIMMVIGSLRRTKYKLVSPVPEQFSLGKGHVNFFKDKILYLIRRLKAVNNEMENRGFKPGTAIDTGPIPNELLNDWQPTPADSWLVRQRIVHKMFKKPEFFWRSHGVKMDDKALHNFANEIIQSKVYDV
jgi:deoxyribonuclease (pyrimidine dimer)